MNTNEFTVKKSTVISTNLTNTGTEIWARDDDGRETSYLVNDPTFRAREGHSLTAMNFGIHPVCLRNDTTMTKIQLLTGEDLLGSGPQPETRPIKFWVAWVIIIGFIGPFVLGMGQDIVTGIFGQFYWLKWLGDIISFIIFLVYLALVFGVPYKLIIRPRILRTQHSRRVKAADAAIAKIFAPL